MQVNPMKVQIKTVLNFSGVICRSLHGGVNKVKSLKMGKNVET